LTARIEATSPDWPLAPVVPALQTMRALALVNAATIVPSSVQMRGAYMTYVDAFVRALPKQKP
jgi:hypothetical protein